MKTHLRGSSCNRNGNHDTVNLARLKSCKTSGLTADLNDRNIFIRDETVFIQSVTCREIGRRADAADGDYLSFELFWARYIGRHHKFIIERVEKTSNQHHSGTLKVALDYCGTARITRRHVAGD